MQEPTQTEPTTDLLDPQNGLFGPHTEELLGKPQPTNYFLQYSVKETGNLSVARQILIEQGLRNHPELWRFSVLDAPTMVDAQTIEDQQREEQNRQLTELMAKPKRYFDPTREDRSQMLMELVQHRFAHNHGFVDEFDVLAAACHSTPDYAWSFASGLAMCAYDEGIDQPRANRVAARFMQLLLKCDITKIPHFEDSQQTARGGDADFESGVLVATNREAFYNSFNQYWNAVRTDTGVAPALSPYAEIDRGHLPFPIAYQFAPPAAPGLPIRIRYLAAGKIVQTTLDGAEKEGISTEPALPAGTEAEPVAA